MPDRNQDITMQAASLPPPPPPPRRQIVRQAPPPLPLPPTSSVPASSAPAVSGARQAPPLPALPPKVVLQRSVNDEEVVQCQRLSGAFDPPFNLAECAVYVDGDDRQNTQILNGLREVERRQALAKLSQRHLVPDALHKFNVAITSGLPASQRPAEEARLDIQVPVLTGGSRADIQAAELRAYQEKNFGILGQGTSPRTAYTPPKQPVPIWAWALVALGGLLLIGIVLWLIFYYVLKK